MPPDDRLGLHEREALSPPGPDARQHDPEGTVHRDEPWTLRLPTEDGELLPKGEVLRNEARLSVGGHNGARRNHHEEFDHASKLGQVGQIVRGESQPSVR